MSVHLFWPQVTRLETSEVLPSNGVIFYTDVSICDVKADAEVFSVTLDVRESYAFGSLVTFFLFWLLLEQE
jgi:hypothetical protein